VPVHSFRLIATYDFCRVTLAFNIREGEVAGTDIGGLRVVAIADTPKVMTEGNWRHVPSGWLGSNDGGGTAIADQRLRHPVRRQDGAVPVRVCLGGVTA